MWGQSLKRPPRGYDPDHPLIDDLKRKDFVAVTRFSEAEACAPDFPERFAAIARTGAGFVGLPRRGCRGCRSRQNLTARSCREAKRSPLPQGEGIRSGANRRLRRGIV